MKLETQNSKLEMKRHSLSHILAMAVLELFPEAKLGIGPAVENGFYYDFGLKGINETDLPKIEVKMRELIKKDLRFIKKEMPFKEAEKIFTEQPYKLELIEELSSGLPTTADRLLPKSEKTVDGGRSTVSIYKTNGFVDLCSGPHVKSTKEIAPDGFNLTNLAGAYWRGDEKKPMLVRIYGLYFDSKAELEKYIRLQEEAKKRDHRIIGKNLDLFVFSDLVGKGLPLFTEKGSVIRRELERFVIDEEIKRGYKHVYTPDLAKVELYKTSGHYPYYKDSMYPVMKIDDEELILRPMTCPHHFQLYSAKPRTYKELPLRIAELAKQFRYEKSGELSGLIRVRSFCLADAHIICRPEQAADEINNVLDLIEFAASAIGLKKEENFRYRLSLGDRKDGKKYYKDDKAWDFAENILRQVLKKRNAPFFESKGEAAFYGPKIDIQMKNFSGKEDTAFTVQYDFVMPKRFGMAYIDEKGKKQEPVVIHRSSIGAIERVMAFLIEHYAGAFPFWLAPEQVWVLPIASRHEEYAFEVAQSLRRRNIRVAVKNENETVGKKIREGELQKIPYLLVVGDKEMKAKSVGMRQRGKGDIGEKKLDAVIKLLTKESKPTT